MTRLLPPLASHVIRGAGDLIAPRAKGAGRLCILNYHRIMAAPDPLLDGEPNVETFEWQMRLLSECFNVLPLHDAIQLLDSARMPARAVAITFDDGYRSIHDLALPVLAKYGLPATVFVTTGHMSEKGSMWNDMILEAVRRLPDGALDLRALGLERYPMGSAEERKRTARQLTERCKYMSLPARAEFTDHLQTLAGVPLRQDLMLDNDMLRTLAANRIEIGGHTVSHPILTRLDDEAARREIADNKRQLEEVIGRPVRLFAYPNGKRGQDYDARHAQMVADAGYAAAFTTAPGAATRRDPRYELPRSRPWDDTPLMFAARLLHWLHGKV
ncbi:polysaccharide deacetylase family protein [Massilia sp. TN1-12]|uniref:polysaccharide deacetylase family protein n=1 Tax=Massilia paldalensis TaxID=3377675 RepID=UPI00384E4232